jgi:alkylation response protein AidB-like acyl-CoA dehydrogenase
MDFDLDETQRLTVDAARRFLESEIAPVARRYADAPLAKPLVHELLRKIAPFGYGGASVPERDGGPGLDVLTAGLLYEELFRVFPGLGGTAFINEGAALILVRAASPSLKARYLPGLLRGDLVGCAAITEPDVGSNPREIRTLAVPTHEGFRLRGRKSWISNGDVSDFAVVVTRIEGRPGLHRILVDRREHGYTSRELPKLGLASWSTAELAFDDVFVPAENLLGAGEKGNALAETLRGFEWARCFVALAAIGIARAALEEAIRYARERRQWGKPIGQHQLVQAMIADMATELDCARLLVYRGLYLVKKGVRCDRETSMAKYYATEAAVRIASRAVEIHGAYGLSREVPVERCFRDARVLTIPDGTSEIQKLIVARSLLGLDAFGERPGEAAGS